MLAKVCQREGVGQLGVEGRVSMGMGRVRGKYPLNNPLRILKFEMMLLNFNNHLLAAQRTRTRDVASSPAPTFRQVKSLGLAGPNHGNAAISRSSRLTCNSAAAKETTTLNTIVQGRNIKLTDSLRGFAVRDLAEMCCQVRHPKCMSTTRRNLAAYDGHHD
jgi:hypothetical protein